MGLTSIADQKTPGRPIEITFDANTGIASANQELLLIGHMAAAGSAPSGSSVPAYSVVTINNVADVVAASGEVATKFGDGSELAKMVLAAIAANADVGGSTFPAMKCIPLASTDTGFGASDAALVAAQKVKAEFVVSCYDAVNASALLTKLKNHCALVSAAQRVENNQYGTIGVAANRSVADPSTLPSPDTQYLSLVYLRDSGSPAYSLGEVAAAYAAFVAANAVPFNPVDKQTVGGILAPAAMSDFISVGAGLESEKILNKGWTPLYVKPNGDVAIVRAITSRITIGDGVTPATAYYDVQDFQVLFLWRKTLFFRYNQPDFTLVKASKDTAKRLLSEVIRLAFVFQDQTMFQNVDLLAKQFIVERSASDRSRFDVLTPVNVQPGLHVIATNVKAGTQFDLFTL